MMFVHINTFSLSAICFVMPDFLNITYSIIQGIFTIKNEAIPVHKMINIL